MNRYVVYSQPNCINCKLLKKMFDARGIGYDGSVGLDDLYEQGLMTTPVVYDRKTKDYYDFQTIKEMMRSGSFEAE